MFDQVVVTSTRSLPKEYSPIRPKVASEIDSKIYFESEKCLLNSSKGSNEHR